MARWARSGRAAPPAARATADALAVFAPTTPVDEATRARKVLLRQAIEGRRWIDIEDLDLQDRPSQRRLRPLAMFYCDSVWPLAAWCEMRQDFRNFRIDRIGTLTDRGRWVLFDQPACSQSSTAA